MFYAGDRVESIKDHPGGNPYIKIGSTGTVLYDCDKAKTSVRVGWDDNVHGHSCGGYCKKGHGWLVSIRHIHRISSEEDSVGEINQNDLRELYGD